MKSNFDYKTSLTNSFLTTNDELDMLNFDVQFSGSTLCSCIFIGNKLISANAGDSRAIVVRNSPNPAKPGVTSIQVEQLTRDHKPDEADEFKRIIDAKGRIEAFKDANGGPMGPLRVWVMDDEVPGLAMS